VDKSGAQKSFHTEREADEGARRRAHELGVIHQPTFLQRGASVELDIVF
jgi:hypothetical protein